MRYVVRNLVLFIMSTSISNVYGNNLDVILKLLYDFLSLKILSAQLNGNEIESAIICSACLFPRNPLLWIQLTLLIYGQDKRH